MHTCIEREIAVLLSTSHTKEKKVKKKEDPYRSIDQR